MRTLILRDLEKQFKYYRCSLFSKEFLKLKDLPGVLSELQEVVQHILVALLPTPPLETWGENKFTFVKVSTISTKFN